MKPIVTVIDYGVCNMFSVKEAFTHCGAEVKFTDDPEEVVRANSLVLPGVGAFADGMQALKDKNLDESIISYAKTGNPLLGICLGMQMLLTNSHEFGIYQGLDLIPGEVLPIPKETDHGIHKIPHIGWNEIDIVNNDVPWKDTILEDTKAKSPMYFVHSFTAWPKDVRHRLADCYYDDSRISAVIASGHIWGCQFHPEKSGQKGLDILHAFLRF
ncbi:imidazole glycerol phosphate synthase subunit HisH [Legionella sp. W05-934-2]|uniref:imidazole glycerol phosphate synthase subunit HisH n=1 Tax=Legionella sp. W05-934-2 TaxID=1198649 RepID=UPI003461DAEB